MSAVKAVANINKVTNTTPIVADDLVRAANAPITAERTRDQALLCFSKKTQIAKMEIKSAKVISPSWARIRVCPNKYGFRLISKIVSQDNA